MQAGGRFLITKSARVVLGELAAALVRVLPHNSHRMRLGAWMAHIIRSVAPGPLPT
jgi:hypothetical protein